MKLATSRLSTILLLVAITLLIAACGGEPETVIEEVEVTRIIESEVEVTRVVEKEIEVTRIVEIETEVEVTRLVTEAVVELVEVTPTPAPVEAGETFGFNWLGNAENNDIKVEFGRFVCGSKAELIDLGVDSLEADDYSNYEYVCEYIWQITNNTGENIQWSFDSINFRINDTQIKYDDWAFASYFGFQPTDEIFTGSTIAGGIWVGTHIIPDEVISASLLFSPARNSDFSQISEPFIIDAEIPEIREFQDFPDELQP